LVASEDIGLDIPRIQRAIDSAGARWTAGDNEIWRMPTEERDLLTCEPMDTLEAVPQTPRRITAALSTPASYSCGEWMTPVRNMGYSCSGSVCAFAIGGAYEARYNRLLDLSGRSPSETDISEQAFLSCYHMSCGGCVTMYFLDYFLASGIPDEACFPYVLSQTTPGPCDPCADVSSRLYNVLNVGNNAASTEAQMRQEIYDNGPIVSHFDIYVDFYSYSSGVYQHVTGESAGGTVMVIYGWGVDGATPYWLCKNHWGTYWGEVGPDGNRGWFRILRGSNESGCERTTYFMTPVLQVEACCVGRVGDANDSGDDDPTIGDISALIDALFISGEPGVIHCLGEADVNQSGVSNPTADDLTIGDISILIDYLFISGAYDPTTNPSGVQLPDCL